MAGQWEQFANNFKTFYELGNKVQTGLATRKILEEEVETLYDQTDMGAGVPHGLSNKFRYDGKIYDQQITPEMLRGLQDRRIADAMIKFGDAEGATKMLTSKAQLKNLNLDNQVKEGTLSEQIRAVKLANDAKVQSMDLTAEQIKRYKELTPLMAEDFLRKIEAQKVSTAQSVSKFANEKSILDDKATMSSYELKEYEANEANRDKQRGLTAKNLILEEKETDLKTKQADLDDKVFTSSYEDVLATRILASGEAKTEAEASKLAAERNLAGNQALSDFATAMKEGGELFGTDAITQQEWLKKRWEESGGDKSVKELMETIKADDLASITAEGSRLMAEVSNAFSAKNQNLQKDALISLIDSQDGIEGNMKFGKDEKGNTVLYEYPSVEAMNADKKDLGVGGEPIASGQDRGWDSFREGFYNEFTPLKSLELAKANADIALSRARTQEIKDKGLAAVQKQQDEIWARHRATGDYQTDLRAALLEQQAILDEVPGNTKKVDKVALEAKLRREYFASTPGGNEFAGFSYTEEPEDQ